MQSPEEKPSASSTASVDHLQTLGSGHTEYKSTYAPEVLEKFENVHKEFYQVVRLDCPEFTSLCPKTGQPDFAELEIEYIPGQYLVESKSLKLYLFSFRNHGAFHEDTINIIARDLINLLDPLYLKVVGKFRPRGGISIWPTTTHYRYDAIENDYLDDINRTLGINTPNHG